MVKLINRSKDEQESENASRQTSPRPNIEREPGEDFDTALAVLEDTLRYSRARGYTGWDYADGMSSRVLQSVPFDNKWFNIAVQEAIKRFPVNIRPLLLVERRRSYKGTALFTMANLNFHRLTGEKRYEEEARRLADWLVENRTSGFNGYCGSHSHQLQHLHHKGHPADDPDVVSTSYGVKALLQASRLDGDYADLAHTAADFVTEDLDYTETEHGARINYVSARDDDGYTLNAVALGARLLVDLHAEFGDDALAERATELLDYVVSNQTEAGGWTYCDPPDASHLSMDNFHNGFIIETLLRYESVIDSAMYRDALSEAIEFYRNALFEPDGAPCWDESSVYPRDVHAATQGILVFSQTGDLHFASQIVRWLFDSLYAGDGRFYFRKQRYYTKRMTLMRWCQAWVSYALSKYLLRKRRLQQSVQTPDSALTSDSARTPDLTRASDSPASRHQPPK